MEARPARPTAILRELRQARRARHPQVSLMDRLAYIEMAIFFWGLAAAILWLLVQGRPIGAAATTTIRHAGPGVIGLVLSLVVIGSLRSGLHGGPLAPDRADVINLLLAPVERRLVLRRPAARLLALATGLGSALGGTLAGVSQARLGGQIAAWALAGAVAGGMAGTLAVAPAMICSGARLAGRPIMALGALLMALSLIDTLAGTRLSPPTWVGAIALWPLEPTLGALAAIPVVAAMAAVALRLASGSRLEELSRRARLVHLLGFSVTMLDVRGFMRVRSVLSRETTDRPWLRASRWPTGPRWSIWQRHARSLLRWSAWRVVRILGLAFALAGSLGLAWTGSDYFVLPAGFLGYMLGMELLDPWWQDLEHPPLTDLLPVRRAVLVAHHAAAATLSAAAAALLPFLVAMAWFRPTPVTAAVIAFGLLPALVCLIVAALLRSSPESRLAEAMADAMAASMPTDYAFIGSLVRLLRTVVPVGLAAVGMIPLLRARVPLAQGSDPFAAVATSSLVCLAGVGLLAITLTWMRLFAVAEG